MKFRKPKSSCGIYKIINNRTDFLREPEKRKQFSDQAHLWTMLGQGLNLHKLNP